MSVINIIFICFIGSGLALTLITIRQRKANQYLKDLSSATKIETDNEYSAIGVVIRAGEYLVKCPDCAEFIKLEANICKNCRCDIATFTEKKREELSQVSEAKKLERQSQVVANKSRAKSIAATVFILLGVYLFTDFASGAISNNRERSAAEDRLNVIESEHAKWETAKASCGSDFYISKKTIEDSPQSTLEMGFSVDEKEILNIWSSDIGKELDCISNELLGIRLSTYFTVVEIDSPEFKVRYLYDQKFTDVTYRGLAARENGRYNAYIYRGTGFNDEIQYSVSIEWDYPEL